jgi:hypothetical protein
MSSSTLSDSTTTSIDVKPSDNKRKPDEVKEDEAPVKKRRVTGLNIPNFSSRVMNTPALTIPVQGDEMVHFGLFTADEWDIESGGLDTWYLDCIFVTDVMHNGTVIIKQNDKARQIIFDPETYLLKVYKNGNIYKFHVAYTLFGMKVEEDSESTDTSSAEEEE